MSANTLWCSAWTCSLLQCSTCFVSCCSYTSLHTCDRAVPVNVGLSDDLQSLLSLAVHTRLNIIFLMSQKQQTYFHFFLDPPPPQTPINAFLLNTRSSCFHSYTELHASVRRREERRKRPMDGGFVFHQKTSSQLVILRMALCYFHMLTFTTGKVCNTYEE